MQEIRSATKERLCAPAQSVLCAQGRGRVSTVMSLALMDLSCCPLCKEHTAQKVFFFLVYHFTEAIVGHVYSFKMAQSSYFENESRSKKPQGSRLV